QIKYFFLATAFGFIGGSICYLPNYGFDHYPYGNFTVCLYPLVMTYALLKHQLMDVDVVIRRTLIYSTVTAALAMAYAVIVVLGVNVLGSAFGLRSVTASIAFVSVVAALLHPLSRHVQSIVDRYFHRLRIDRETKLEKFSNEIVQHDSVDRTAQTLCSIVQE